jgi:hypothetical protein
MALVLLYYILHYYSGKKKAREKAGHAQNILQDMSSSGDITSGCSPSLPLKGGFVRAHILLTGPRLIASKGLEVHLQIIGTGLQVILRNNRKQLKKQNRITKLY